MVAPLTLYEGLTIGTGIVFGSSGFAPPTPSYSFGSIPSSINEGSAGTFNVTTTNVSDGTTLYWTVSNTTTSNADFSSTSGSFTITSNAGSFTVTPTADATTEGSETFTVALRTVSITGTVVATSSTVTINDTSTTPTGGLKVYLQSAPTSGSTWSDTSGNGYNATLYKSGTGNYVYNSANGGGIVTTGSTLSNGAMIDIPYNLPSTFSIEIVASISATNYWASLFGNEAYGSSKGFLAYWGLDTLLVIGTPSSGESYSMSSGAKANRNHYLITVTGSTLKFYLNGTLKTKSSGTFAQPSGGLSTNSLQIGARHPNSGTIHTINDAAHGTYYMVRVYDSVLDQTAVTTNYNEAKAAFGL
jgi:Concanavalin A-like lectin/glucanases superfamily